MARRVTQTVDKNILKQYIKQAPPGYRYNPALPLQLADKVSSRGDPRNKPICIHDLSVLLSCWKSNDYNQSLCSKELQTFNKCWDDAIAAAMAKRKNPTEQTQSDGKLSKHQVNNLLKRFPQPKS
ncbi:small ribosomal subunit protein mS37-like [Tubulanus polymorphus]|uniref:small ribosomal subunit protein mS37-like n=1 Tax=Tubulanus polymorphus TaxID=672921 RepID=UPI003DA27EA5